MLLDRDVFPREKPMIAEAVSGLFILGIAEQVVVKRPRSAGLADEMSDLVGVVVPEAAHTAAVPGRLPLGCCNPAIGGEWSDELIASLAAPIWKIVIPS